MPLSECERRDPKGIYKKARAGQIKDFTGISAPYKEPEHPEVCIDTEKTNIDGSVQKLLEYLYSKNIISLEHMDKKGHLVIRLNEARQ